jgi:hypothetical protein
VSNHWKVNQYNFLNIRRKDKIEITDMEKFLKVAEPKGLLRAVPESYDPDMRAVAEYTKMKGIFPSGTVIIPAQNKTTYKTKRVSNGSNDINQADFIRVPGEGSRDSS